MYSRGGGSPHRKGLENRYRVEMHAQLFKARSLKKKIRPTTLIVWVLVLYLNALFTPFSRLGHYIKSNHIKYIYLSQAKNKKISNFITYLWNLRRGGIDRQGLFNTQPPTGEPVFAIMLTWRVAAGCHAAHGVERAGATGEDTVHKRTGIRQGEVGFLHSRGGTHKNKWELKGGARITK